jgi:hypothetical protein
LDNYWNKFLVKWKKNFFISKTYILDLKISIFEKEYKNQLKTLLYLWKDLTSLEKDFFQIIKKIEKEKLKKMKRNLEKLKRGNILPWERLKKVQVYNKEENYDIADGNKENKNWILYYFLIIIFSFSLFFILLKREEVI